MFNLISKRDFIYLSQIAMDHFPFT